MAVYFALTDGYNVGNAVLRLVDSNEVHPELFRVQVKVSFADPRSVIEMSFKLPTVVFPGPGEYRVQLYWEGTLLMERQILLMQMEGAPE